VGQIRTESSAAATDADGSLRGITNVSNVLSDENGIAVLPPGSGLEFGVGAADIGLLCSFFWRERPAEESELTVRG